MAALVVPAARAVATEYVYSPNNSAADRWWSGVDWSPGTPAGGPGTTLTFVGANGTVLASGLANTNTNNVSGAFALNLLNLQGTGPAVGGSAASVTIASTDPSTGLTFVRNGTTGPVVNLNANVGTLANGLTYTVSSPIALGADTTFAGSGTAAFNFAGVLSGPGRLIKTGSSAVAVLGTNTFSGGVALNGGTLQVGASGIRPNGPLGTGTLTLNGGKLFSTDSQGTSLYNPLVLAGDVLIGRSNPAGINFSGGINFTGPVTLTGTRTLTIDGWASISGNVVETGGSFGIIKRGPGNLNLSGRNSWTGATVIEEGAICFQGVTADLPGGTGASVAVNAGATVFGVPSVGLSSLLSRIVPSSEGTLAGADASFENLDFTNYPKLHFGATRSMQFWGTIKPAGGVYRLGAGGAPVEFMNANILTGARALEVGVGSTSAVVLSAANDFTGPTTVGSGGTLWIRKADSVAKSSGVTVAAGGTVELTDNVRVIGKTLTINGGGSAVSFGALSMVNPFSPGTEWAGPVILGSSGATIGIASLGTSLKTLTVSGVIDDRPSGGADADANVFDLVIRVAPDSTSRGSVVLSGANTYHGNTVVATGELKVDGGSDRLPAGTTVVLGRQPTDSASFNLNGQDQRVAGLARLGRADATMVTNTKGGSTSRFTLDTDTDQTFDGMLTNASGGGGTLAIARSGAARLRSLA
jgi:fibronectin-binding autotransporter adhesin